MIKPPSGGQPSGQGQKQTQRQGLSYLAAKDLTKDPIRARITACKSNVGSNAVVLKILIAGNPFLFGLKDGQGPNLATLFDAFGSDENDWVNKEIMLANVFDEFAERWYVTVTQAPAPEVKGEKPKRSNLTLSK